MRKEIRFVRTIQSTRDGVERNRWQQANFPSAWIEQTGVTYLFSNIPPLGTLLVQPSFSHTVQKTYQWSQCSTFQTNKSNLSARPRENGQKKFPCQPVSLPTQHHTLSPEDQLIDLLQSSEMTCFEGTLGASRCNSNKRNSSMKRAAWGIERGKGSSGMEVREWKVGLGKRELEVGRWEWWRGSGWAGGSGKDATKKANPVDKSSAWATRLGGEGQVGRECAMFSMRTLPAPPSRVCCHCRPGSS